MNELVKITHCLIDKEKVNSVNARELHKALDSKQQFAHWIKSRIKKLNLIEGIDLIKLSNQSFNGKGGDVKSINYIITLDIAKHLCMMEATDKGRKVRQYFIECEKKLTKPLTLKESLLLNLQLVEENERLELENKNQADRLISYKEIEKSRRSKATLKSDFNRYVRTLAERKFNKDYKGAYNHIYKIFGEAHNFNHKINMKFIENNLDYLSECLTIVLAELD